jgi:hypothetical protein
MLRVPEALQAWLLRARALPNERAIAARSLFSSREGILAVTICGAFQSDPSGEFGRRQLSGTGTYVESDDPGDGLCTGLPASDPD